MNQSKDILNHPIIEWKNQVVITTALLADFYETDANNVKNNFNNHKSNFIEGKHYFLLQGEELKEFKNLVNNNDLVDKRTPQLYLWTERGADRHCKILDTDKAWEQFDNLEETYFSKKRDMIDLERLDPQTKLMNLLVQSISKNELEQKRQAEQLNRIEQKQDTIVETFTATADTEDFKTWVNKCINRIAESPMFTNGSTRSARYQNARAESYDRLNQKRACRLTQRVAYAKETALQNGATKTAVNAINRLTIIAGDKDLKPIYETVIKEMMIAYCVEVA